MLEPRLLEFAGKQTILAKQRQPLLVGPDKAVGVERNLYLEQIAVDDTAHPRPAERDHHRRPRAERQRATPQAVIATPANEAPATKTTTPAISSSSSQGEHHGCIRLPSRNRLGRAGRLIRLSVAPRRRQLPFPLQRASLLD